MSNDWKSRLGMVYSTNPDYVFEDSSDSGEPVLSSSRQDLRVWLDRRKGGKVATVVRGFRGSPEELRTLGASLKAKCGVGGTAKDGEILIQGDFRDRVVALLQEEGYKVKKAGG